MLQRTRNVAVLGATGSIGCSALDVIRASRGRLTAVAMSAHSRLGRLLEQACEFQPTWIVATEASAARRQDWSALPSVCQLRLGHDELSDLVARPEIDIVLAGIVGSAGLRSTWAAVEAGKQIALANKETLVMAGPLVMKRARETGAAILPVDSEHNAVFQALSAGRRADLKRIILTASGGPFRTYSAEQLATVTVQQALAHPTWSMGPKITVDSATMMNKALEIIEARWLFDVPAEQIQVVVHPQSIVHSMVEFVDGAVIAELSPPDMRLPIQHALTYPERWPCPAATLDWSQALQLEFHPADHDRFPALELGLEAARMGGTTGVVLNAANEAAVAGFLSGQISFLDIVPACRSVLDHHDFEPDPTLGELLRLDAWARKEISRWVCT